MSYTCGMSTKTLNFTFTLGAYHSDGCKACLISASIEVSFSLGIY